MRRTFAACLVLAVLFVSSTASAQSAAEEIRQRVKQGQKVSITDEQGREFDGRIHNVTAQGLTIRTGDDRADVPFAEIVRIDRPEDTLWNGARIGFVVGAGLALLTIVAEDSRSCGSCDPVIAVPAGGYFFAGAMIAGGVGAAVGVGVDALIRRDPNIYRRAGTRISVSPLFGRGTGGAVMGVSW